jgi:hypothetical protein
MTAFFATIGVLAFFAAMALRNRTKEPREPF